MTSQTRHLTSWMERPAPGFRGQLESAADGVTTAWITSRRRSAWPGFSLPLFRRSLALVRVNPWWYEPCWATSVRDWKEDREIPFVLLEISPRQHLLLLTLASAGSRTFLRNQKGRLFLQIERDADAQPVQPWLCVASGTDPVRLVRAAMERASRELKSFRLLRNKRIPDVVQDFGWCTWDAFYKEVDEKKIRQGLRTLGRGGVRPRMVIIDDGWQQTREHRLTSLAHESGKFPQGLKTLIEEVKRRYGVRHVGVWHALQGYWQGVDPKSSLGRAYPTVTRAVRDEFFRGWDDQFDARRRHLVHPREVHRFFQDYHRLLRQAGVDFVKVDNQGSLEYFCRGVLPLNLTHRVYQDALQASAGHHFNGGLIHCMANCHDILLRLDSGVIWRNSDDFFPRKDAAVQAAHLVHNAFNNLWTHTVALPDWDMFWSRHPHAAYHALGRAISGGPIYVSDRPGKHDFSLLRQLVLDDGRALRWPQPALPALTSLYRDPRRERCLLKISNRNGRHGALAVFHAHSDPTVGMIEDSVALADVEGITRGIHAVWDAGRQRMMLWDRRTRHRVGLGPMEHALFLVSPVEKGVAPFGLLDKINSSAAITVSGWSAADTFRAEFVQGGRIGFYAERAPRRVWVDGKLRAFTWRSSDGLLEVRVRSSRCVVVDLQFAGSQRAREASRRRAPSR